MFIKLWSEEDQLQAINEKIVDIEDLISLFQENFTGMSLFEMEARQIIDTAKNENISKDWLAKLAQLSGLAGEIRHAYESLITIEREEEALLKNILAQEYHQHWTGEFNKTVNRIKERTGLQTLSTNYSLAAHLIDHYGGFINNTMGPIIGELDIMSFTIEVDSPLARTLLQKISQWNELFWRLNLKNREINAKIATRLDEAVKNIQSQIE